MGFQPDWLWVKIRDATGAHTILDVIRGTDSFLESNTDGAAETSTATIDSFDSDGFTVTDYANTNQDTKTFVAWNWKAGGAGVSNTEGSLDATVSANTTAGFSIVRMDEDGTGAAATVGHGLTQAPELVIGKPMNAADSWRVGSDFLTSWAYIMRLQTTVAEFSFPNAFNSTAPTATLVTMGSDGLNNSGPPAYRSILYCFHSVEGYSKVGSYVGNGNADGTFIYTGFRPAWILVKNTTATGNNWEMWDNKRDTYNIMNHLLEASSIGARITSAEVDFVSNGFKVRSTSDAMNDSGENLLYLAFAESPFKYSNAR